jgi:hypothetical protein
VREDPVIPSGLGKVLGVLLVIALLGGGAYVLAGDRIDLDLPDLPDLETSGVTTLENTDLSETTINGGQEPGSGAVDPFTSAGFAAALTELRGAVGDSAELTRLFVNNVQTQFIVRRGDGVEAYSVRSDSGELTREDATISISGGATIADFAYPLGAVKPAAIDRMLASARKLSGASDFRPGVLALERAIPFGEQRLGWTINAQGKGRYLLYRADADGRGVRNEGGEGIAVPPAALEAQKLNDCIADAGEDTEKIFRCLEDF